MNIKSLVSDFATRLHHVIEGEALERARTSVLQAFGIAAPKKRGRPPKAIAVASAAAPKKARKRPPLQLCPVPGCKNAASPALGMVCGKHRDVPKAKIKMFREARRLAKLKAAGKAPRAKGRAASKAPKPRAQRVKKDSKRSAKKITASSSDNTAPPSAA